MRKEFKRWGLENKRIIIATCQLAGGAGLLLGLKWNTLLTLSSFFFGSDDVGGDRSSSQSER